MMGRRSAPGILAREFSQIEPIDHLDNERRKTILGQPVLHRGREQIIGLSIYWYETAHLCLARANSSVAAILPARRYYFEAKVRQAAREYSAPFRPSFGE